MVEVLTLVADIIYGYDRKTFGLSGIELRWNTKSSVNGLIVLFPATRLISGVKSDLLLLLTN